MKNTTKRTVVADEQTIIYTLEYKAVKNLNLRIRKDGNVFVSASSTVPAKDIDEFVRSKTSYILNAKRKFSEMAQFKPQPKQYVSGETFYIQGRGLRLQLSKANRHSISSDGIYIHLTTKDPDDFDKKHRMMSKFLDQQCNAVFSEVIDELYPLFKKYGVEYPTLRIRDMETRWGSCLVRKGVITLNKRLLEVPRNCIEYVVMHELCHFMHPNHSKHFYTFLTTLMPDWKERKNQLEKSTVCWL